MGSKLPQPTRRALPWRARAAYSGGVQLSRTGRACGRCFGLSCATGCSGRQECRAADRPTGPRQRPDLAQAQRRMAGDPGSISSQTVASRKPGSATVSDSTRKTRGRVGPVSPTASPSPGSGTVVPQPSLPGRWWRSTAGGGPCKLGHQLMAPLLRVCGWIAASARLQRLVGPETNRGGRAPRRGAFPMAAPGTGR